MRSPTLRRTLVACCTLLVALVATPAANAAFTLTATPSDGKVALDWPDAAPSGFYDVYRDGAWVKYLDTASQWTDTGLTNGRTYRYRVEAYNWAAGGGSTLVDQSNEVSVTPPGEGFACFDVKTLAAGARPPACWRPFNDTSPFNVRIPATPRLATTSASSVSYMMSRGTPSKMSSNKGGYDWEHANYFAKSTDPLYTIHCREPWGTCPPEGKQYRIPAAAKPAGYLLSSSTSPDRHLSVVQPDGVTTVELWLADTPSGTGGTLNAAWGDVGQLNGTGVGVHATGAELSAFAGTIRAEQLVAGRINHALFAVVPCTKGWVFPASKGTYECGATNAPPTGARLQLNMTSAEINALAVPQWKKVVLQALREYGMIIGDTGGGDIAFGLQFESGMVDRAFGRAEKIDQYAIQQGLPAWTSPSAGGRTTHIFDLAPGIDWAGKLRVVDPCVSQRTC